MRPPIYTSSMPSKNYIKKKGQKRGQAWPDPFCKGYGKEFTHAIVNHLVPCLIKQNFQVKDNAIRSLIATAGCNNTASNRILNIFLRFTQEKERYGSPRMWYQQDYKEDGSLAV